MIDSDCCWVLIPSTVSSLTLRHRLAVYLQTAKWALVSFFFHSHLFLLCSVPLVGSRESGYVELDTLDKRADGFPQIDPRCHRSRRDVARCIQTSLLWSSNPPTVGFNLRMFPQSAEKTGVLTSVLQQPWHDSISCHHQFNDFILSRLPVFNSLQAWKVAPSLPPQPTPLTHTPPVDSHTHTHKQSNGLETGEKTIHFQEAEAYRVRRSWITSQSPDPSPLSSVTHLLSPFMLSPVKINNLIIWWPLFPGFRCSHVLTETAVIYLYAIITHTALCNFIFDVHRHTLITPKPYNLIHPSIYLAAVMQVWVTEWQIQMCSTSPASTASISQGIPRPSPDQVWPPPWVFHVYVKHNLHRLSIYDGSRPRDILIRSHQCKTLLI